ncbi:MAG: rod shape-determining protein RodA [Fimbriimonadaceae bacterium]|nr:rod shape-determining protein RodA [Fimbriimonadaceae bacterium]QYK55718.1 MAG: rod shape-determining protein RodA [Fimbriimonadaceae bacterium]
MIGRADAKGVFGSGLDRPAQGPDVFLLLAAGMLLSFGLLSLHSIDAAVHSAYFFRQAAFVVVGCVIAFGLAVVPHAMLKRAAVPLYLVSLGSLAAVLFIGQEKKGATRWIDVGPLQFQPSEFAKLVLVITLAAYLSGRQGRIKDPSTFFGSLLHVAPVVLLTLLQPHLAGAVSLLMIWFAMLLACGVSLRPILLSALVLLAGLGLAWKTPGLMPDYMRSRIEGKLRPDVKDNAWQQERAKIAFATGGLFGVGYLKGEQKAARYVPEQQNDFILTVVGEEGGLFGTALVLLGFALFFFRTWLVGWRASEPFDRYVAAGILGVLGFHMIVNVGMNLGILPVAGLWLPFMSYGGTAMWMCLGCVGLLLGMK